MGLFIYRSANNYSVPGEPCLFMFVEICAVIDKIPGRPLIQKSIPNVRPTVLKKDPYQGLIFYETKPHIKDFSLAKTKFHGRIVN